MVDWYTKAVLTLIAVSLATIALRQPVFEQANAQGFGSGGCGEREHSPCYIKLSKGFGMPPGGADLSVEISNR